MCLKKMFMTPGENKLGVNNFPFDNINVKNEKGPSKPGEKSTVPKNLMPAGIIN
jgi:hypothetical protein